MSIAYQVDLFSNVLMFDGERQGGPRDAARAMCNGEQNASARVCILQIDEVEKDMPMDKIVMTLLVPRDPPRGAHQAYAVQITFPSELTPGKTTPLTSVRLIDYEREPGDLESLGLYRPDEWRAATLWEQAEYAAGHGGNLQPWFNILHSLTTSVYDFAGAGDKDSNNGQVWAEIATPRKRGWIRRGLQQRGEEEMYAEWSTLFESKRRLPPADLIREKWSALIGRASRQVSSP
jgi:hypothetical protein